MSLFSKEGRDAVTAAVADVEKQTAAEIVVAVRVAAAPHREIDVGFGAALGFFTLLVLLFYPRSFSVVAMPFDVAVVAILGTIVCRRTPWLKQRFLRRRPELTLSAARAAFVELGVSRTRGRTGVLVFAAMLEREVVIVGDVAVPEAAWQPALGALNAAAAKDDATAFAAAVRSLGPSLQRALPRADDDEDELSNVVA